MGFENVRLLTPEQILAKEVELDRQRVAQLLGIIGTKYAELKVPRDMQKDYQRSRRLVANIKKANEKLSQPVTLSPVNRVKLLESLTKVNSISKFFGEGFSEIAALFNEIDAIDAKRDWYSYDSQTVCLTHAARRP